MRIWFDTEFFENGRTIDLISIGVVREDGATFYAETDFADAKASQSDWLKTNVRPHLKGGDAELTQGQLRRSLTEFVGPKPEFWAYYAAYDWVTLCQLFGTMMDLPSGWPMYCRDVQQLCDDLCVSRLPSPPEHEHHALSDAIWTRDAWKLLTHLRSDPRRLREYIEKI